MSNNFIKSFSIQELVNTIPREDFNAFLNKFLSTTNIEKMNEVLNLLYTKVKEEVTNATEDQKEFIYKNAYHYMMSLLYNEAITIEHAIEKLKNKEPDNSDSLIQHFFTVGNRTGIITETVNIDKDLANGLGTIGLSFDRTPGIGEVEILVKEISLNKTAYIHKNLSNGGKIYPNQYNGNKTYAAESTENGYKLTFTASATADNPSWDSFLIDFDKTQEYESLTVKFEVIKSDTPLDACLFQFNDWAENEPENSDALVQHYFSIGDRTGVIEETFTIDKDLNNGLGSIGLCFDRTPGAGDVEILIKEVSLNKKNESSSYIHNNISNNGTIYPNPYNVNKTYSAKLTDTGYKLKFTSSGELWDAFLIDFDKEQKYKLLTVKFEVLKSNKPLNECLIQFNDWADSEADFFKKYYTILCGFGPTKKNAIYREYFVRDYIANIYHHRTDVLSYKDIDNIKEEFGRIWGLLTNEEKDCTKILMGLINNETIEGNNCPENFYKFFTRINDESADCEKNIELLSYILNKDKYSLPKSDIAFIPSTYEDNIESGILLSLLLKIKETTINY